MEEYKWKKKKFLAWVKEHKVVTGIGIVSIIGTILTIRNQKELLTLWKSLKERISKDSAVSVTEISETKITDSVTEIKNIKNKYTLPQAPVEVPMHIRKLSGGRHHSAEKALQATELNIILQLDETLVDSYVKYVA